ncbi:hypothetical protein V1511DRAFT_388201 [Dipodascopsis uninucleata]
MFLMSCVLNRSTKRQKRAGGEDHDSIKSTGEQQREKQQRQSSPLESQKLSKNTIKAYVSAIVNLYEEQKASGINLHAHPRGEALRALLDSLAENEEHEHRKRKPTSVEANVDSSTDQHDDSTISMHISRDHAVLQQNINPVDISGSNFHDVPRSLDSGAVVNQTQGELSDFIPGRTADSVTESIAPQMLEKTKRRGKRKRSVEVSSSSRESLGRIIPEFYEHMNSLVSSVTRSIHNLESNLTNIIKEQNMQILQMQHQIEELANEKLNTDTRQSSSGLSSISQRRSQQTPQILHSPVDGSPLTHAVTVHRQSHFDGTGAASPNVFH